MKWVAHQYIFALSGVFLDVWHWNLTRDWFVYKRFILKHFILSLHSRYNCVHRAMCVRPVWNVRYLLVMPCNLCAVVASLRFRGICIIAIFVGLFFILFSLMSFVRGTNITSVKSTVIFLCYEFDTLDANILFNCFWMISSCLIFFESNGSSSI